MKRYGNGFDEVLELIGENTQIDKDMIIKAYEFADQCHEGQMRYSGDKYIVHPVAVAKVLTELGMDSQSIMAALLHDVVEDTDVTLEQIKKMFGADVAQLVDGVTKLGKIPLSTKEEEQAENIRKMFLAMAQDVRVIIIKLADRLHNMRTLSFMREQKRRDKALETLEIYAPIAHRLGIRAVKEELEDLAIRYLDPVAYDEIKHTLMKQDRIRTDLIPTIKTRIADRIDPVVKNAHISGRIKSVHGIYRKMYMQNRNFDEIYDIYAIRIIVDTVTDCYNCLGVIHDMFRPIPGRFKDYISTPKPNMYQSLHSTVISKEGIPFEVQIRTWEMHRTAEYGIAAHWKYKQGLAGKDKLEERLAWIRQMIESQGESDDAEDVLRTIKSDLAIEEVYVFTPNGDVKTLPMGATVIDFAYAIHSAVGNRMIGAKVNGRMVSLDYQVKTGEIVEILTSSQQGKGPSRDWLKIVKTSEARTKIRSWYKKERREENIIEGKAEIEREFKRNYIRLSDEEMAEFIQKIAERQRCANVEELYAKIGYGGIIVSRLMPGIKEMYQKIIKENANALPVIPVKKTSNGGKEGIIVEGVDNCLIKLSKCCNPLPGDNIIGFITRGHGVSIHKKDCNNVPQDLATAEEPDRWLPAYWDQNVKVELNSTLSIYAINRDGLLADLTAQINDMRVMLRSLNARVIKDGNSIITLSITVEGTEHLKNVINKISKINGVISIERSGL